MTRRFQFSLRTALLLVFVMALLAWPTASLLRSYLANRGLVPVAGLLVFKGAPVSNATITFTPKLAGAKPVRGTTDAGGRFQTDTPAAPGAYTIAVGEAAGGASTRIPPRYTSAATSGLVVEIHPAGNNQFDFLLVD